MSAGGSVLELDGSTLTTARLHQAANQSAIRVELDPGAMQRMQRSRKLVLDSLERGDPVYGLTTGLGSRSDHLLDAGALQGFSIQTLRGRAQSIGPPLNPVWVRAAMLTRLNTLLIGGAGADPQVAICLQRCLGAGLVPWIGETGSIGVADLCWGATLGLALAGEGKMFNPDGSVVDAGRALASAGLPPLVPGPRDGLALASHSCFSGAILALASHTSQILVTAVQSATAITMEAFRANPTPLDPIANTLNPQPGQKRAAQQLRGLLEGSSLFEAGGPAKLQDPLSIRNAVHVHAAAYAALDFAGDAVNSTLNGVSDNPLVDLEGERILSCGSYYTTHLTIGAQTISSVLTHVAVTQLARTAKLLSNRFSGLPQYLAPSEEGANGFAPLMKIAEALLARISHAATPVQVWPSANADGVEDVQTHAPLAAKALMQVVDLCTQLCAIELIVAAEAFEQRAPAFPAPAVVSLVETVRRFCSRLSADRPMSSEIEALAAAVTRGLFAAEEDRTRADQADMESSRGIR